MLQNKFEMPLDLKVKPSKLFNLYLLVVFIFSFVGIFLSSLPLSIQLFLCVTLLFCFTFILKKKNSNKIISLKLSRDDKWKIELNNHQCFDVELEGECIVTFFLVWLNFSTYDNFGRKNIFRLLLLPDSIDEDSIRRLRVRLRFLSGNTKKTSVLESD